MTPASKQWSMLIANYITHAATNVHLCKSRKKLKKISHKLVVEPITELITTKQHQSRMLQQAWCTIYGLTTLLMLGSAGPRRLQPHGVDQAWRLPIGASHGRTLEDMTP